MYKFDEGLWKGVREIGWRAASIATDPRTDGEITLFSAEVEDLVDALEELKWAIDDLNSRIV